MNIIKKILRPHLIVLDHRILKLELRCNKLEERIKKYNIEVNKTGRGVSI